MWRYCILRLPSVNYCATPGDPLGRAQLLIRISSLQRARVALSRKEACDTIPVVVALRAGAVR